MIVEYHRPDNLQEAIRLLSRKEIKTVPLGGGSVINTPSLERFAVVDLQDLGLNQIQEKGNFLIVGATVTLQSLLNSPVIPENLPTVIRHEAAYNLRQVATVAGTLVSADGRSPFATALLALDAQVTLAPGHVQAGLGDIFLQQPQILHGRIITTIHIPGNAHLSYEYVARTPADLPIVCIAAAAWPSGRIRLAAGGFGDAPALVLDGPEAGGVELAARDAYHDASDQWASSDYRREVAAVLAQRCIKTVFSGADN
jgi:CO/xanthine dehydrogenase FAD-binding subunit